MSNFKEELKKVRAFVFDMDGVIASHTLFLDTSGTPLRTINVKDGLAIHIAVRRGYPVAVISGGRSYAMRRRMKRLGVHSVYFGARDKKIPLKQFLGQQGLSPEHVLYMGDDIPDLEAMGTVGFPTCPGDAVTEVKQLSRYISPYSGGDGCVRDIIEQVLRLHGQWSDGTSFNW